MLLFYRGSDIADITVEVTGPEANAVYAISELRDLCSVNFEHDRRTIVFASGWVSDSGRDIKRKLEEITKCCDNYNVIIVDFATSITHLYTSATSDIDLASYALLKVLDALLLNDVDYRDIILVGHSVGTQIAATASKWFSNERLHRLDKLPLLVALDPTHTCSTDNNCLSSYVANQTLVIHGNNGFYGISEALGTVDYYPNGDCQMQPSCKSQVCSHVFPVWVFVESVCKPDSFYAVQCKDTESWKRGICHKNEVIQINLDLPPHARGKFFSATNLNAPYGQGEAGTTLKDPERKGKGPKYGIGFKPCSASHKRSGIIR